MVERSPRKAAHDHTHRALLLADAERQENLHRAPRDGASLHPPPREHRQGRPVQGRLPEDLAEQPDAGDRRPRRAGRRSRSRSSSSGAILQYLARKTGRFYGRSERERVQVEEWLYWQVGGIGPMAGPGAPLPALRPGDGAAAGPSLRQAAATAAEVARLYGVLDRRLASREYVAGDYSIADMAIWPWANALGEPGSRISRGSRTWRRGSSASGRARRWSAGAAVATDRTSDLTQGPRGAAHPLRRRPLTGGRVPRGRRPC